MEFGFFDLLRETVNDAFNRFYYLREDTEGKFKPTTEWMEKWYTIMNNDLFQGMLGGCRLTQFTTGRGSNGNSFGWFKMDVPKLYWERDTKRLYKVNHGLKVYINRNNFVAECNPTIALNSNYSATEEGWLGVLVHEMCHYYTFMDGICPKQAHGPEFKQIGSIVARRSNGRFSIDTLMDDASSKLFELDADIYDKKLKGMFALVIYKGNEVRLVTTSSRKCYDDVINSSKGDETIRLYDKDLLNSIWNEGFNFGNSRKYMYYSIEDKQNILKKLDEFPYKTVKNGRQQEPKQEEPTQLPNEPEQSQPQEKNRQNVSFNGNFAIIRDGGKFNVIDKAKRKMVFSNSVDNIWFKNGIWIYQDGKNYFITRNEPYNWSKIAKKEIIRFIN